MPTRWRTLVTGALLLGATTAAASDLCFQDDLGFPPLVARDFSLPAPGRCAAFTGFLQDGVFLVSGMACGSATVDDVDFEVRIEAPIEGEVVSYGFSVHRQTLRGEGAILCAPVECGRVFDIPLGSLAFSIHTVACRPS